MENGSGPSSNGAGEMHSADVDSVDLHQYLELLGRYWKWVFASGLVVMAAVWLFQLNRVSVPVYTAAALVQRLAEPTELDMMGLPGSAPGRNEILGELEIIRTGQVLQSVVDSLGLRLILPDNPTLRSEIFSDVVISFEAAPRNYTLRRQEERLVLSAGGQEVAEADPLGIIVGPGLTLVVERPDRIPEDGLAIRILANEAALTRLSRDMEVDNVNQTNLIRISYSSPDDDLSARVANALAAAYQEQAAARAREEATRRRQFLTERIAGVADSLRAAQDLMLGYQSQMQTVNPQTEGATLTGMLIEAEEGVRTLNNQERILEDLIDNLQVGGREGLRQMMVVSSELVPGADALFARLQEYEDSRNTLVNVNRRTASSPEVQLLDSLIAETQGEMQLTARQSLRLIQQNRERVQARAAELRQQVGDVPERNVIFGRLQQRVVAIQSMYDMLAERFYEAQIAEAVEAGDVQIVDPAVVPSVASSVNGARINPLLAFLMGLLIGFAGVLAFERMDTRIRRPGEVRTLARAEIIATVPNFQLEGERRIVLGGQSPDPSAAEAFRMLRTNLRFVRTEELAVIALTSAGPMEGKSLVSANLAVSLAQEGKRVLLIDADLRRPVQHTLFSFPRTPGLSDTLVEKKGLSAVHKTTYRVDLITAGTQVPNPAELLGSAAFVQFLATARERYDIVIVDTPPVLAVAETSMIAPVVDGVLMVVRQERTHRQAITSAVDQIRRSRAWIMGVVVNGVEPRRGYGYGSYGYGYTYGYGASEYYTGAGKPKGKWASARNRLAGLFSRKG